MGGPQKRSRAFFFFFAALHRFPAVGKRTTGGGGGVFFFPNPGGTNPLPPPPPPKRGRRKRHLWERSWGPVPQTTNLWCRILTEGRRGGACPVRFAREARLSKRKPPPYGGGERGAYRARTTGGAGRDGGRGEGACRTLTLPRPERGEWASGGRRGRLPPPPSASLRLPPPPVLLPPSCRRAAASCEPMILQAMASGESLGFLRVVQCAAQRERERERERKKKARLEILMELSVGVCFCCSPRQVAGELGF